MTRSENDSSRLRGGCSCGAFSFETRKVPAARFACHCLFCQDFTGNAFSDVSVLMAHHIELQGTEGLIHKKYRPPPNLNRSRCATCGKPAMEAMGAGPLKVLFVPSESFVEQHLLPPVQLHVFYNRRVADAVDDLPKYSHYWPSEFAITKAILGL